MATEMHQMLRECRQGGPLAHYHIVLNGLEDLQLKFLELVNSIDDSRR